MTLFVHHLHCINSRVNKTNLAEQKLDVVLHNGVETMIRCKGLNSISEIFDARGIPTTYHTVAVT